MFVYVVVCTLVFGIAVAGLIHELIENGPWGGDVEAQAPITVGVAALFVWGVVLVVLQLAQ